MKNIIIFLFVLLIVPNIVFAGGGDDPVLTMLSIDQLEVRVDNGSDPLVWEAEGWVGKDLHKLWLKTDGEYRNGKAEEVELQALYSRAVAPFWDMQLGLRRDIRPTPDRDWLAVGVKGLAPYFFDIDAAIFIGESGQTAARLQAEYEFMLTQRLILVPEVEINIHGKNEEAVEIGSGVSNIEAGLRLRYEIRREFAPYIGINWNRFYGNTADLISAEGEDIDDLQIVVGVKMWL